MKRTVLNLGAILVAFIIGIAINNACADSLDNMTDTELRRLVSQLQQEVNSLKSRVAELEGKIPTSSGSESHGDCGIVEIDGWHFSEAGSCLYYLSDCKKYTIHTKTTLNGTVSESTSVVIDNTNNSRQYDNLGRIISSRLDNDNYTQESIFTYSKNTWKCVSTTKYKNQDYEVVQTSEYTL